MHISMRWLLNIRYLPTFVPLMKRQVRQRILTAILGLITAGAVVLSQAFYYQLTEFKKESVKTEQSDSSSQDKSEHSETFISVPDSSIPSTFTIVLNQELTVVREILFRTDNDGEVYHTPAISAGQIFRTLFSVLISPNAP